MTRCLRNLSRIAEYLTQFHDNRKKMLKAKPLKDGFRVLAWKETDAKTAIKRRVSIREGEAMRNRPSFLKFSREIQKNSRGVLTQRKKSCILRSNRLLTYCQAHEGVIHYESYRRQISAGSDCDIPWHFNKHGGSVLFSHCGGFRNR